MTGPAVFNGNVIKLLKAGLDFFGQAQILSGTVDPTSVATSAPKGSLYLNTSTGLTYRKTDAGSTTNWVISLTNPMTTGGDTIYGGASGVPTRLPNGSVGQFLRSLGGTTAPAWANLPAMTIQTLAGSGTYTLPTNCRWIEVEGVGPGGGGQGSGTAAMGTGGSGSANTTFGGVSDLIANLGTGGGASPGVGGTFSILGTWVGVGWDGADGDSIYASVTGFNSGGRGGSSFFGGAGATSSSTFSSRQDAKANSGSGGSGGGTNNVASSIGGTGGGAGGYFRAIQTSPAASYSYAIGNGGSRGAAGTLGFTGGLGGAGRLIVREFY